MRNLLLGLFFVLFLGSLYFSRERILFADSSFILFRIINLGCLQLQEHRYGSFITQIFPLIASGLHLPLAWIVVLYSASFNLFYLAVAALLVLRLKDYWLALLMSFYFLLFVSDTYFWMNNEVHQGIAWMFLFFGVTRYLYRKSISLSFFIPVFSVLAFLSVYTHPLVMFPILFLWLFFLIEQEYGSFKRSINIVSTGILLVICISKFFVSSKIDHYDSMKLNSITNASFAKAMHAFLSPEAKEIIKRCLTNYWLVPVLFFGGLYAALRLKKYKLIILTTIFCLAYFVLVCLTLQGFLAFYTESELMPLTIMATACFIYFFMKNLRPRASVAVVVLIFIIRIVYIGIASEKFVERKEWIFAVLEEMREKEIKKGIVYNTKLDDKLLSFWAVPEESLIASSLLKDIPNLTFVLASQQDIQNRLPQKTSQMISSYGPWDIHSLNTRYFNFDTTSDYQLITPIMRK